MNKIFLHMIINRRQNAHGTFSNVLVLSAMGGRNRVWWVWVSL